MKEQKQELPVSFEFSGNYGLTSSAEALLDISGRNKPERHELFIQKVARTIKSEIANLSAFEEEKYTALLYNATKGDKSQLALFVDLRGNGNEIVAIVNFVQIKKEDESRLTYQMSVGMMTRAEFLARNEKV
jgi:hypothetical protein